MNIFYQLVGRYSNDVDVDGVNEQSVVVGLWLW